MEYPQPKHLWLIYRHGKGKNKQHIKSSWLFPYS